LDTSTFSLFFALLTLLGLVVLVVAAVLALLHRVRGRSPGWLPAVADHVSVAAVPLAFAVALTCTAGSLYYSEVAHYEPCRLCWYQRIAMYPLVVVFGVAWFTGDRRVRRYGLPLAGIGLAISLYHRLEEQFPDAVSAACSPDVPCSFRYVDEFGWVTIPTMAAVGFALILFLMSISTREVQP
jgi:disulfide bond formation protein DsbB